jgi:hypothetical protein
MTKLQEMRLERDTQIVETLKQVPRRSYLEIAAQFRVCQDVVIRVAKQNNMRRSPSRKQRSKQEAI